MMKTNEMGKTDIGGFTLIELVIAILVFALGIMGVAKMQSLTTVANSYGAHLSQAVNIAQDEVERLKALPASNAIFNTAHSQGTKIISGMTYTIDYNVYNDSGNTKDVNIVVSWLERSNDQFQSRTSLDFTKR